MKLILSLSVQEIDGKCTTTIHKDKKINTYKTNTIRQALEKAIEITEGKERGNE